MKKTVFIVLLWFTFSAYGPGNCELYQGECKRACLKSEDAIQYSQGSATSQEKFDEAIEMCPTFDYPYYEKAVPYAKRGDIMVWKELIDKAVEIDPIEHLANRGWYHFFFLNNYEAAINDIEKLDSLNPYDIGSTGDAIYHLNLLKGICYFEIGEIEKAIQITEKQLNDSTHFESLYDNICLGAMYLENKKYKKAIEQFKLQAATNDLAENHFYLAKVYYLLEDYGKAIYEIDEAAKYYTTNRTMENGYRELPFEIYQSDIKKLRIKISNDWKVEIPLMISCD